MWACSKNPDHYSVKWRPDKKGCPSVSYNWLFFLFSLPFEKQKRRAERVRRRGGESTASECQLWHALARGSGAQASTHTTFLGGGVVCQ